MAVTVMIMILAAGIEIVIMMIVKAIDEIVTVTVKNDADVKLIEADAMIMMIAVVMIEKMAAAMKIIMITDVVKEQLAAVILEILMKMKDLDVILHVMQHRVKIHGLIIVKMMIAVGELVNYVKKKEILREN